MKSITSKIVRSLNESIDNSSLVTNEEEVGVVAPKEVHQCDECHNFYLVNESSESSKCPYCGGPGKLYKKLDESEVVEPETEVNKLTEDEEEELRSEADMIVSEALDLLNKNDYHKFNESYRPRVRVNSKGQLEALVESKGHTVTASRRMTSRQKTAYKLSERYTPAIKKVDNKKLESIKLHRQELLIKNESRAVKLQACKLLERQGASYDFNKFNKSMNKFISERIKVSRRILEDIADDEEIGKSELDNMTTDEIADQVETVIKDTGLEVINKDVDIDGDTATVSVRVEDNDQSEVHTSELEDVLSDVFDKPVEIVGPNQSEGDKSVVDLAVVINPDNPTNEDLDNPDGDEPEDPEVPAPNPEDQEKDPEVDENLDDPDDKFLSECDDPKLKKRNESLKSRRRRVNEKFVKGTGEKPLFALLSNASADNAPEFLAQDDSMVSGNEEGAENLARIFVSEEAASQYLASAGIDDKFTPVSITVITNESLEDSGEEVFKNEDGFFKKDKDGNITEIDESEYEAKKDLSSELSRIKESMKRRRRIRK